MATFAELRSRFSDDRNEQGKQFERVCKWFLETDPRYSERLVKVWLWNDWPGRWGGDLGIDLVAEDRDGSTWAIQAKCVDADRSVTKAEIDSFLSESGSEGIDHLLLIATTNHIGRNARAVIRRWAKPVFQLLLADLESAPVIWPSDPDQLKDGGPRKPMKRWPHQTQAINNVTKNLEKRGQMISACGTGKTLAALWISERLEAKRTLVVLPSLTLLSQSVSEWLANTKEPFDYLPVCSDETVSRGNDAATLFTSDLGYPVTTEPDDIAAFLRRRGRRVVFSTYQSSPQIAEAQTRNGVPGFDLVIADEAHRCAGKVSSAYGTVLDDKAIRAKKRLFTTATPRTYSTRVQKQAREVDIEVASMDDETVFGPVIHKLNFGEAIERDLLTDYQVVVVGVDEGRYKEMVDERRLVKTDQGTHTDAETLAKHVALVKTIGDYGLQRTITFHSRIKTASAFADMLPRVASWMPSHQHKVEIVADHVSGEMSAGERNKRLNWLRNVESGQSAVLTNAQCLSEGVDVPALDGVGFMDPRRSQVDIVQAVGRAIRRSEDKTVGTIVIPVFLSDTDDPDHTLSESEFEPVWSILRALRSHDDSLGEALDECRISLGRRGNRGSPLPPKIKLDLPEGVSPEFAQAFATRLVKATTAAWEEWFGRLESYVAEAGDAAPLAEYRDQEGNSLGTWVSEQRADQRKKRLSIERAERLESLPGWSWDPKEDEWNRYFDELVAYTKANGDALAPASLVLSDGRKLGSWVSLQRQQRTKKRLPAERANRLESLPGWSWDPKETEWNRYFDELVAYVEKHGTSRVVRGYVTPNGLRLGEWVGGARSYQHRGKLREDRISRFEALPFWTWDAHEADFDEGLVALTTWVEQHGHTNISAREEFGGIVLGRWVSKRRAEYRRGVLTKDRVKQLEAIPGWIWDLRAHALQEWQEALLEYISEHGHTDVPESYVNPSGQKLGYWVKNQRIKYRDGRLDPSVSNYLENLPEWMWAKKSPEDIWKASFAELEAFANIEGHARPKAAHKTTDGLALGNWVLTQRQFFRKKNLSPEKIALLEALPGWVWNSPDAKWEETFTSLEAYVAREGHARVPQSHRESDLNLGVWVNKQRSKFRRGAMPDERIRRFEALPGWVWNPGNN